jgi:hypothetical protein
MMFRRIDTLAAAVSFRYVVPIPNAIFMYGRNFSQEKRKSAGTPYLGDRMRVRKALGDE